MQYKSSCCRLPSASGVLRGPKSSALLAAKSSTKYVLGRLVGTGVAVCRKRSTLLLLVVDSITDLQTNHTPNKTAKIDSLDTQG